MVVKISFAFETIEDRLFFSKNWQDEKEVDKRETKRMILLLKKLKQNYLKK